MVGINLNVMNMEIKVGNKYTCDLTTLKVVSIEPLKILEMVSEENPLMVKFIYINSYLGSSKQRICNFAEHIKDWLLQE